MEIERKTICNLIYFNGLLIVYNFLFLLFSVLDLSTDSKVLELFIPVICLVETFILTSFTLRYFKIARVMKTIFSDDFEAQVKATKPKAIKRNKLIELSLIGFMYTVSLIGSSLRLSSDFCIAENEKLISREAKDNIAKCLTYLYIGVSCIYLVKIIIFGLQLYSVLTIFKIVRRTN